jgi:hypothetical protein
MMNKQQAETNRTKTTDATDRANLDRQYRSIGISAVAAALPYSGAAKNPRYAPAHAKDDRNSDSDAPSLFTV